MEFALMQRPSDLDRMYKLGRAEALSWAQEAGFVAVKTTRRMLQ